MEAVHFFSKNRISPSLLKAYRSVDCIQVLSRKDIEIVKEFCGNIEVVYIPNTVDMPDKIIKTKKVIIKILFGKGWLNILLNTFH